MKKVTCLSIAIIIGLCSVLCTYTLADVATFDNNYLAPESHWGGAGSGETTGFTSGDAHFPHYSDSWSWDGFLYSNETDTTTPGNTNQFSAITSGGVNSSANYCVSCIPLDWMGGTYDPIPQTVSFGAVTGNDDDTTISGAFFTNTTYAYLSMRDGDAFAKKFGGATGNDADWFKLIIKGIDNLGSYTGTVDFYLADFRSDDNSQDYIVDTWKWVDLTSLGDVIGLEFSLASTDVGSWGINTPMYFAMDDLNGVPEPMTMALLGLGGMFLVRKRKA